MIDEANRAIDEMNNRTIDGIKVHVSMAKRQLNISRKGSDPSFSPATNSGSSTPAQSAANANINSWSTIAANFSSAGSATPSLGASGIKKEGGTKSGARELVVYEDDIPDD